MKSWDQITDAAVVYLPLFAIAAILGLLLWGVYWLVIGRHERLGDEQKFPRQILMLVLLLFSVLVLVLALPVSESSRNHLIGLIGLLVSGIIAFSSTNILANLMAGILLRITKPFRIGDFIRAGDCFGRVSERGLFDTEIQTESRELIALPNAWLIKNPVTTIRSSGVIISTTLSLGYDVHHDRIEPLLLRAAETCGLEEPFVHILELGNFAVTYRVSGILTDTKRYITARSNLCRHVLDTLHGEGVEIMSPAYMNQRRMNEEKKIVPENIRPASQEKTVSAEDLAFDKAEKAEQVEKEKIRLKNELETLEAGLKEAGEKEKARIREKMELLRERFKELEQPAEEPDQEESE